MDIQVKVLGYKLSIELLNYVSYNTVTCKIKFFQKTGILKSPRVDIMLCLVNKCLFVRVECTFGERKERNALTY